MKILPIAQKIQATHLNFHIPRCGTPQASVTEEEPQSANPEHPKGGRGSHHIHTRSEDVFSDEGGISIPQDVSKDSKPPDLIHLSATRKDERCEHE